MANRNTRLILKNSVVPSQTLPASGSLLGESLVNLGDGVMFFSGGTSGSPTWVQSDNPTPGYFEVGSNLYQLKIRDKIIAYSGVTNLSGKFLSGTTSGFVLADISDIASSVDSYVTGTTWNPNTLTIELNNGKPSVPVTIDSFTALTINGNLDVTGTQTVNDLTITGTGLYNTVATGTNPNEIVNYSSLTAFSETNDVYVTGSTLSSATDNSDQQSSTLLYRGTPIGGPYTIDTENTFTTGGTYSNVTNDIVFDRNDGTTYTVDLSSIDVNDTYVTGGTNNSATDDTNIASIDLLYNQDIAPGTYSLPYTDSFTTGGTYDNNTALITFDKNDGTNYTVDLSTLDVNDTFSTGGTVTQSASNDSNDETIEITGNDGFVSYNITGLTDTFTTGGTYDNNTTLITFDKNDGTNFTVDLSTLDVNDTFVTGFTYDPLSNTFTISRNEGEPDLTAQIDTVSGLTVANLTSGRVVYVGTGGLLTDESGFTYDENTNTLGVENIEASGNVVIQGDLTVLGQAISAFTSNLYVEDPNITLNYSPTGDTTVTSVNAGFTIQDGSGVATSDVNFDIVRMQNLTGLTTTEVPDVSEYTSLTGYANRGWITQLNDIVIRSTDVSDDGSAGDINGVRVLAEWDVLDGGQY
jgi:hypothetical protein